MKKKLAVFIILVMALWLYGDYDVEVVASTAPQSITTSWVDLGSEITCTGYKYLHIFIQIDINGGANIRLKALPKLTLAGTVEYEDAILTVGSSLQGAQADYIEFSVDEDRNYHLIYDLKKGVDVLQLQVQAGTAGTSQIDSCYAKFTK